jgi:predicted PilT family ATPase
LKRLRSESLPRLRGWYVRVLGITFSSSLTLFNPQADETSEVLKIPTQYHSSLIGQSGKYVIRLEEKYGVKITFPREAAENGEGKTRESLKPDEVLIKGGKKGVAGAKSEIVDVSTCLAHSAS